MKLTELLSCDAYINGNVGSGSVKEMAEWVEYLTSGSESPMTKLRKENGQEQPWKVRYFAIGNENWGCGGNMTADFYTNTMKQYSTFLKNYSGNRLYRVACGPYGEGYDWTETLMKDEGSRNMFEGLSIHYYTVVDGWGYKGSATEFDEREWFESFRLSIFNRHADRVKVANLAQVVNVLQSVILTITLPAKSVIALELKK
jgi:alpha-N-arabinofuranosidase